MAAAAVAGAQPRSTASNAAPVHQAAAPSPRERCRKAPAGPLARARRPAAMLTAALGSAKSPAAGRRAVPRSTGQAGRASLRKGNGSGSWRACQACARAQGEQGKGRRARRSTRPHLLPQRKRACARRSGLRPSAGSARSARGAFPRAPRRLGRACSRGLAVRQQGRLHRGAVGAAVTGRGVKAPVPQEPAGGGRLWAAHRVSSGPPGQPEGNPTPGHFRRRILSRTTCTQASWKTSGTKCIPGRNDPPPFAPSDLDPISCRRTAPARRRAAPPQPAPEKARIPTPAPAAAWGGLPLRRSRRTL